MSVGATALPVASTTGLAAGQQVTIDSGNGSYETETITSVPDSTDVDVTALTKSHSSGASVYSGVNVITPPELNWSVWSTIIHGGRGIIYFDHSNTASGCVSDNYATTTCAQTTEAHQSVSIDTQMATTDAQVKNLAPEINSQTALGYVTVNPAPTTFGGIEDRAVWDTKLERLRLRRRSVLLYVRGHARRRDRVEHQRDVHDGREVLRVDPSRRRVPDRHRDERRVQRHVRTCINRPHLRTHPQPIGGSTFGHGARASSAPTATRGFGGTAATGSVVVESAWTSRHAAPIKPQIKASVQ